MSKDIRIGLRLDERTHKACQALAPEGNISMWLRSLIAAKMTRHLIFYNATTDDSVVVQADIQDMMSDTNPEGWTYKTLAPSWHYVCVGDFDTLAEAEAKIEAVNKYDVG